MLHQYDKDRQPIWHCTQCQDTGFERGREQSKGIECSGDGRCGLGKCGAEGGTSYPHTFTRPCFCRGTNPFLIDDRKHQNESRRKSQEKRA